MSTWELKKSPHYRYILKNKKVGAKKFTPTYRRILKNTSSLFWFHICINILNIIKIF